MTLGHRLESMMRMDDRTWARHASPWSVWTRIPCLPLLVVAVWSRVWLGWWALVPVAAMLIWIWVNPRAFPPPASTDNWASKVTFGERVWLNRKVVLIPAHHARAALLLSWASGLGIAILIYGLIELHPWLCGIGTIIATGAKLWFVDRMVWLYEDMRTASPDYDAWIR